MSADAVYRMWNEARIELLLVDRVYVIIFFSALIVRRHIVVEQYEAKHKVRYSMTLGLTGMRQISGLICNI